MAQLALLARESLGGKQIHFRIDVFRTTYQEQVCVTTNLKSILV
jgi:hypothetical protein